MNAKPWPLPKDSNTDTSAFMEHRGGTSRGEMNDQQLADALDVSVGEAHARIEDVTEHRSTDLDWDS